MHHFYNHTADTMGVEVLLVTFAELSGVPFLFNACNESCQKELMDKYGQKNVELQKQIDIKYEENIKIAQQLVAQGKVDLGPSTGTTYTIYRTRHRRRKGCSIM